MNTPRNGCGTFRPGARAFREAKAGTVDGDFVQTYEREAKARVPAMVRGRGGTGVRLERNGSYLIPETEEWIMYDVKATGFHLLLDKRVPATMEPLAPALMDLAGTHGWDASDLDSVADRPPTSGPPTSCEA